MFQIQFNCQGRVTASSLTFKSRMGRGKVVATPLRRVMPSVFRQYKKMAGHESRLRVRWALRQPKWKCLRDRDCRCLNSYLRIVRQNCLLNEPPPHGSFPRCWNSQDNSGQPFHRAPGTTVSLQWWRRHALASPANRKY